MNSFYEVYMQSNLKKKNKTKCMFTSPKQLKGYVPT